MKRQWIYLVRVRRHLGWGRVNGYAGVTNSPFPRERQHRATQQWSDLDPIFHFIPLGRVPRFVALIAEWLLIKATLPLYNVQHNRSNPRRITPRVARLQRAARDGAMLGRLSSRAARVATYRPNRLTLVPVVTLAVVAVALWSR